MSRNMGSKNTTSPEQDFSKWSSLRLKRYQDDLEKLGSGQDRKVKDRVTGILDQREKKYDELEEKNKGWIKTGKTIDTMNDGERKDLDEAEKALEQKFSLLEYDNITFYFQSIEKLLSYQTTLGNDEKIIARLKEIALCLKEALNKLNDSDKSFIKIPEWWENVQKEYAE